MKIIKKRILITLFTLLLVAPYDIHAISGPQIQTYDTLLKNMFQQAVNSVKKFFSYVTSSLSTTEKTGSLSLEIPTMSKPQSVPTWVILTGAVLTAATIELKTGALRKLLAYIHNPFNTSPSDQVPSSDQVPTQFQKFETLPPELRTKIIKLAIMNSSAKTLSEATYTIRALSLVNSQLNEFINQPDFCLKIIKRLGKQYEVPDQKAAEALNTTGARARLALQKDLQELCGARLGGEDIFPATNVADRTIRQAKLIELYEKGADLNFSYAGIVPTTPLILALDQGNYNLAKILLEKGSDVNQVVEAPSYSNKNTALILFTRSINRSGTSLKILEFLLRQKNIIIDQMVPPGNDTALTTLAADAHTSHFIKTPILKTLLEAGANPTKRNNEGQSAESLILGSEIPNKQELLDLIEGAKHNKKWEQL